jgi:ABC-type Fe3+/spermidine/putrescine transport system ATPase subunit
MTVVYVTPDLEEAMNMSDRIAIMSHGRIAQVGTPSEVYERPASTFVGRFLGEANILPVTVTSVAHGIAHVETGALRLRAAAQAGIGIGQQMSLFVRPERIGIGDLGANQVTGCVRRVSFLGSIVRYQVEIAPSVYIAIDVQNLGQPGHAVGAPIALSWRIEDCLVLVD